MMHNYDKSKLFVAIKALERAKENLQHNNGSLPKVVDEFLLNAKWLVLGKNIEMDFQKINKTVSKAVVDFEEADVIKGNQNQFLFALSTFILYFIEGDSASLEIVLEEVVQYFRNFSEEDFFTANSLGATILTQQQIEKIEQNPLVQNEILAERQDLNFAMHVTDWSKLSLNIFD